MDLFISVGSSVGQLSPPNRISAINLVGDLLRKVGVSDLHELFELVLF